VRGEHCRPGGIICGSDGSSPRAGGTHRAAPLVALRVRFIAAFEGNTACRHGPSTAAPVHSRVREGRLEKLDGPSGCIGSSPRARGTPWPRAWQAPWPRFIPPCAGNTLPASYSSVTIIRLSKNLRIGTPVLLQPFGPVAASAWVVPKRWEEQPPDRTIPAATRPHLAALAGFSSRFRTGNLRHSGPTRRLRRCHPQYRRKLWPQIISRTRRPFSPIYTPARTSSSQTASRPRH
jgi:hypothetical protein